MSEIDDKQAKQTKRDHKTDMQQDPNQEDNQQVDEIGGPKGLEPTRYGDWEKKGRCVDF